RDMSPDNVMISFDGQVKVIDFGIAKAVAADAGHTSPGVMKGKLLYASPEQLSLEKLDRELLGRGVEQLALHHAGAGVAGVGGDGLRDAEVDDLHLAVEADHHVVGRHVP